MKVDIEDTVADIAPRMFERKIPHWRSDVKLRMTEEEVAKFEAWEKRSRQGEFLVLKSDYFQYGKEEGDHPCGHVHVRSVLKEMKKKGMYHFVIQRPTEAERNSVREKLIEKLRYLKEKIEAPPDSTEAATRSLEI